MKLDMDCVRDLLASAEELANGDDSPMRISNDLPATLQQYTPDAVRYHAKLCGKAGYIEIGKQFIDDSFEIVALTMRGYDAMDSIRNPKVYSRAKREWLSSVRDGFVSATISGFFSVAAEIARNLNR